MNGPWVNTICTGGAYFCICPNIKNINHVHVGIQKDLFCILRRLTLSNDHTLSEWNLWDIVKYLYIILKNIHAFYVGIVQLFK